MTSPQRLNGSLRQEFDGLGVTKDSRAPLTLTGLSQASSSTGHEHASDTTESEEVLSNLPLSQAVNILPTVNGVRAGDYSRSRLTIRSSAPTQINQTLRRIYFETYMEYAYVWCPTLDQDLLRAHPEFADSVLLNHSLALVGANFKPPLLQHTPTSEHYQMARHSFYNWHETNPLVTICAIMLFHYWDMSTVATVNNTDTDWWWLGNAIRLAQAEGLQREGKSNDPPGPFQTLKRRIWWALFVSSSFPTISTGNAKRGKRQERE